MFAFAAVLAAMVGHPVVATAHGVGSREMDSGAAKAMVFLYADGEPMAFAQVQVLSPGPERSVYQSARTDGRGQFAFVPAGPGIWSVAAVDGQGHRAVREVTVANPEGASALAAAPSPVAATASPVAGIGPGWREVVLGVSLFLNMGLAGILLRRRVA
jgi:nickel transport protein